ncbi:hypothetical protein FJO69_01430 [[Mycoplasma] falconis]|uniref:DUF4231 domain-containing protein n=1 Tax=[Mycoplasma] falconis TaxID=92403 RepID=A0A501XAT8_9BACT|nr:hypothetical protein [[Mycoplasma] falconis]TPE57576.1 hypothetical protein FJO69_01430 [[Mycoplasma] falconis]
MLTKDNINKTLSKYQKYNKAIIYTFMILESLLTLAIVLLLAISNNRTNMFISIGFGIAMAIGWIIISFNFVKYMYAAHLKEYFENYKDNSASFIRVHVNLKKISKRYKNKYSPEIEKSLVW